MALAFSTALRTARSTAIRDAIGPTCKIRIYAGVRPASGGTATTLLAELTGPNPSGAAATGVFTFGAITADSAADATGTATWFRVLTTADVFVIDGSVTATGGGGDMQINTTSIVANAQVQITSFTITEADA